jgi:regulator of protease activity HflC (stomatin/prohibitin superfamily)
MFCDRVTPKSKASFQDVFEDWFFDKSLHKRKERTMDHPIRFMIELAVIFIILLISIRRIRRARNQSISVRENNNTGIQTSQSTPQPPIPPTQGGNDGNSGDENDNRRSGQNSELFLLIVRIANIFLFVLSSTIIMLYKVPEGETLISWKTMSDFNLASIGITFLLLQAIYTFVSFQTVQMNRRVIFLFFGRYVRDVNPGIVYVPFPFCQLISVSRNIIERDLPASPENIYHGDLTEGTGIVPEGKTPALRVTFAAPENEDDLSVITKVKRGDKTEEIKKTVPKDDAYYSRLTAEIEISYGFRVIDLRTFYEVIGTVDNAVADMDDHTVAGFTSRLQRVTVAEAMLKLDELADEVKRELCDYSEGWGIDVTFARIKPFGQSHTLNTAVAGVSAARENKKAVIHTSEGEMEKLSNEGFGRANAEFDLLSARAVAQKETAKVASTPGGQFALGINAVQRGLETARAVIVPQDNLFGAVAGITELLKQFPASTPSTGGNQPAETQDVKPPTQTNQPPDEKPYGRGKRRRDNK